MQGREPQAAGSRDARAFPGGGAEPARLVLSALVFEAEPAMHLLLRDLEALAVEGPQPRPQAVVGHANARAPR